MNNFLDVMGREVSIGDTVAYAANTNKCAHLRVGTVIQTGSKTMHQYVYSEDTRKDVEIPFIQVLVSEQQLQVKPWLPAPKKAYKMRVYAPNFVIVKKANE
jgi:hypothetical protein